MTLEFVTNCGSFTVTLDVKGAPHTSASLVSLARADFYDDTIFHRIVPGFVIQGGDPTQTGAGGPGYQTVDPPAQDAAYTKGVVAMAKTADEAPGTAGSQFFVVTGDDVGLPPDYAIVGTVTSGLDVVERIGTARRRSGAADRAGRRLRRRRHRRVVTGVGAVVLAAGEASRFGSPKQRLLLPAVLERLAAAPLDEIVVVEGAHPLDDACDTVSLAVPVRVVRCADWERGPGASLRCGLAALGPGCEAAVVALADGPDLSPAAVARVADDWRAHGGTVVAASYGGVRGHPLLLAPGRLGRRTRRGPARAGAASRSVRRPRQPRRRRHAGGPARAPASARRLTRAGHAAPYGRSVAERSCVSRSSRPGGMRSSAVVRTYTRSVSSKR